MSKLFGNKTHTGGAQPGLGSLVAGIRSQLNANGHQFISSELARKAVSLESIDSVSAVELEHSIMNLGTALESIFQEHGNGLQKLTVAQKDAGVAAAVITGSIQEYLHMPINKTAVATESLGVVISKGNDFVESRMTEALEAYDEKENRNTVVYSVAYNMQAARQDEFGEAFYPTVIVTPDQVGFTISIRLVRVMDEIRRQVSGAVDNFKFRNIIQAVIDPTILKNDLLTIVPVYRDESKANFVDSTILAPYDTVLDGQTITTSSFAVGKKFNLLGISQTEALLETGLMDNTDSIDTAIELKAVVMQFIDPTDPTKFDVVKFNTQRSAGATFTYSVQENYRKMSMLYSTESLHVSVNTKTPSGAALSVLAPVVAGEYSVRLGVSGSGSVNLQTADTSAFFSEVSVVSVTDKDGNVLSLTSGAGKIIADLFAKASVVAYDLDARRTNLNRRMRGRMLDTTFYNQVYTVPLRSPLTIPRPLSIGDANDASDLAALVMATHVMTSNAAVEEIIRAEGILSELINSKDSMTAIPEVFGVSRFLIKPFFEKFTLDVKKIINSTKSAELAANIQGVLVNKLRDMAYRMYRDTGYKAAADALAGGVAEVPTVILGTDPVTARYLTITGDFRTLGNDFNVKVVQTLDQRVTGKIFMAFGNFSSGMEGVPNPMHFGNMAWQPEITMVLPIHRNGANNKELTVQPAFLHVTNTPALCVVDVIGLDELPNDVVAFTTVTQ